MEKSVILALGGLVLSYFLHRLLFGRDRLQEEYNALYNRILTSDKHKVKGQYGNR